jgi:hypothetical protein
MLFRSNFTRTLMGSLYLGIFYIFLLVSKAVMSLIFPIKVQTGEPCTRFHSNRHLFAIYNQSELKLVSRMSSSPISMPIPKGVDHELSERERQQLDLLQMMHNRTESKVVASDLDILRAELQRVIDNW